MEGFNLGVSFTIAANQIPYGLGLMDVGMHKHRHLYNNIGEFWRHLPDAEPFQTCLTLAGFVALVMLNRWRPRYPWFVVLACIGGMFGYVVEHNPELLNNLVMSQSRPDIVADHAFPLLLMEDRFPLLGSGGFSPPRWADAQAAGVFALLNGSAAVMLLVVFEGLLSGALAERRTGRPFDPHAEVLGVGVANVFCGLAGGFPCTAALARTNLNVVKGATSRAAGLINAVTVFVIVTFFQRAFRYLPLPVVASMMLMVTFGMPDWNLLWGWWSNGHTSDLYTAIIVAMITIVIDPGMGLVVGLSIDTWRRAYMGTPLEPPGGHTLPDPHKNTSHDRPATKRHFITPVAERPTSTARIQHS
jgi:MFS superfamily sulfate permease-like transporter